MATTTTNFGWDIPQSTDLVKDGATAIAALGQDIDTALVDLKGGTTGQVLAKATNTDLDFTWVAQDDSNAIQNAIVDAKGDLIAATAADTPARLAIGTNGQVLTVDSTTATGLKWDTASSGGYTTIASGTISASTLNITSIPSTYKELILVMNDITSTNNFDMGFRFNSDTGSNYVWLWNRLINNVASSFGTTDTAIVVNGEGYKANTQYNQLVLRMPNYAESTWKLAHAVSSGIDRLNTAFEVTNAVGSWKSTSAISSIVNINAISGTYVLYGVK